jgi:beta-lactam-binding protein with PASTA domain
VAETVRRLGGRQRAVAVERNGAAAAPLPRDDWSVWLIGLVLLAGLAAFMLWLTVFRHNDGAKAGAVVVTATSTVPKVTGIRYQAAQFQLREAKLTSRLTRRNASKPKGVVIAQRPTRGKSVPQGTPVALVVSKGPPGVAMPDVVGLAAADAVNALQARKLRPTLQQTASSEAPGTVVAQQPKPGRRTKPGTAVVLQVAKGATMVSVPDVTSRTEPDATATLKAAGLAARTVHVPSTQAAGTVVGQSPAAGQKLAQGGTVRLNVAKGSTPAVTTQQATTAAPPAAGSDYAGMRLGEAVQQIADGRQQAIVVYASSSRPVGVVVSNAKVGSRERLQVSAGPQPKPTAGVPDVTGEDTTTAQQDLRDAGFAVVQVTWPVSDPSQDGVVVYETPSATARIPQGSVVVVYVGSASGG